MSPPRIVLPNGDDPQWGPSNVRVREEEPGWIKPYTDFLSKYAEIWRFGRRFRINTAKAELPSGFPGDVQGRTTWPWQIWISIRVRDSLFDGVESKSMGGYILFRQVAYAEFWQRNPFLWYFRWLRSPAWWGSMAEHRASELMDIWEWNLKGQPSS